MLLRLLLLTGLTLLTACGKQGGATSLEVTLAALNLQASGEIFLIAKQPSTGIIRREKLVSDPQTLELPNGFWEFHIVFFDGGITGTPRCGSDTQELAGSPVSLSITVTNTNCLTSPYTSAAFVDSGLQQLVLQSCTDLNSVGSDCSGIAGTTQSYQVMIPNITFSQATNPTLAGGGHVSNCINYTVSTGTNSNIRMPQGTASLPFPFAIRSFSAPNCAGSQQDFSFPLGLLSTNSTTIAKFDDTGSTPNKTWAYIKHDSNTVLKLVANNFNIPAASTHSFDLTKFITGGTAPITSACVTCGSATLVSNIYTNDNSTSPRVVSITDATGRTLSLTMTGVTATVHDFTASSNNGWTTTRSSTLDATMPSSGTFSTASSNTIRFAEASSGDGLGMLVEPSRSNNFGSHNVISGWNTMSGTVSYAASGSSPHSSYQPSLIDDTNSGAVSTRYSPSFNFSGTPGVYTVSMYLKKDTSDIVYLYFMDIANSCNDMVINLTSGTFINGPSCGSGSKGIIALGGGWYRVWMNQQIDTSNSYLEISPAWNTTLSTSSSAAATGGVFVWGVQYEKGSYPTSPILTTAGASTRVAGAITHSTFYNIPQTYGTVMLEWNNVNDKFDASTLMVFRNSSAPATNAVWLQKNSSNQVSLTIANSSGYETMTSTAALNTTSGANKVAFSYGSGKMNLTLNSQANTYVQSLVNGFPGSAFDQVYLGTSNGTADESAMVVKKIYRWDSYFIPQVTQQLLPP